MASKYVKGDRITSLDELAKQQFVFMPYGVRHAGFVQSQQFRFLKMQIDAGRIYKAIPRKDLGEFMTELGEKIKKVGEAYN